MRYRITISLPCFGRPQRTLRALESIFNQTANKYELLLTGDACPEFNKREFCDFIRFKQTDLKAQGNKLVCFNNDQHTGNWGSEIRDQHIADATGELFMFMGSDDVLLPTHLENIFKFFDENPQLDFGYFDTYVEPNNAPRNAQLQNGSIGHSEIIAKTAFIQKMPKHEHAYGHDWHLIQNMVNATNNYKKAVNYPQTYIVKSIPGREEIGID